ncbi:PEP-CTERM protein-sorting domain-containing protein [Microbacterium sp. LKL04]|uniref:hypothetical protein n=1 Tax=Microbacterium sp. LKL04 TaxID=912630 RepID=UPI000875EE93|nr:hypothetical protein [Microbacterium sp. LKL04]SCY52847.1 PEP-CTERM protein-sorting domain-containing protein [Microbacterium sp. LKL04]
MSLRVAERSPLAGAQVVRDVLGAVVLTVVAGAVVWAATSTSRRVCAPVPSGWWGGLAPAGAPEEFCAILHLEPSPLVLLALALVLVFSISRVLRVARSAQESARILSRAVTAIVIIAAVTVVVGQAWLWLYGYPSSAPDGALLVVPPFPFAGGSVEEETFNIAFVG